MKNRLLIFLFALTALIPPAAAQVGGGISRPAITPATPANASLRASELIAQYPLIMRVAALITNFTNSEAAPLFVQCGPGAFAVGGKFNGTIATSNNSTYVQIPSIISPCSAAPYGYHSIGTLDVCVGGAAPALFGTPMWFHSDSASTAAMSSVDPRTSTGTFTVVAATDVVTTSAAHYLLAGNEVRFTTTTTLPAGLSLNTSYYVLTVPSTTTLTLTATKYGSTVVDITTTGTGTHTWRSAAYRHLGLGLVLQAGAHTAAPESTGGGINVTARFTPPDFFLGGVRLPLVTTVAGVNYTDDVVILFPKKYTTLKMVCFCHGAGIEADGFLNSASGLFYQQWYAGGQEPMARAFLDDGWIIVSSRGATTTEWGNGLSYSMWRTAIDWVKARFAITRSGALGLSMGGLAALQLCYKDPNFGNVFLMDPVCDLAAMYATPSVTTGDTRDRFNSFTSAISTAHGGAPSSIYNPVTWSAAGWSGKKLRSVVNGVSTSSTDLSLGCDGTVARRTNWDALATIASGGGATVTTDNGTDTGGVGGTGNSAGAGYDHGRMGNFIPRNAVYHLSN